MVSGSHTYSSWIEVILPLALPRQLTYGVPDTMQATLQPGCRVVVQVGKNKMYTALVYRTQVPAPEGYQAKPILEILDDQPVVTPGQIRFWEWIASYYMCTLGEVMNVALPSGLRLAAENKYILATRDIDLNILNNREYLIVEALSQRSSLSLDDIVKLLGIKTVQPYIKSLIEKGYLAIEQEMKKGFVPKKETYIELTETADQEENLKKIFDDLIKAPKQLETLMRFIHLSSRYTAKIRKVKKSDLLQFEQVSAQAIRELVKKNVFKEVKVEVGRFQADYGEAAQAYSLTDEQQRAVQQIKEGFAQNKPVLLHGVTSSGKTEVYVSLIKEYIDAGKQVLYLLPEIALTTQLIQRLQRYFPGKVGVYHSRFNENERVEVWNEVLKFSTGNTRFQIILGARSALFLPYTQLGLVVVDEEHDASFKQQDPDPRYNARDAAIYLATRQQAQVLLGSATPSLESYHNVQIGKYALAELKSRFGNVSLPEIVTADVKYELKHKKMQSHFTSVLLREIQQALDRREQVILFQNRRGYAPMLQCGECGWVPQCKHCDISLIYHKNSDQLRCHYCGYTERMVDACKACGSVNLDKKGFGTEKVEDELLPLFPKARIARLDLDTTRRKNAYQEILHQFADGAIDILVGTQMITKGLDFDHVSVVGILNADNMLHFPDFRAHERAYQLMSQVAGRAGRRNQRGKVVIQTYNPQHAIIRHVIHHDYEAMARQELLERSNFKYPPYYKFIEITLKATDYAQAKQAALQLAYLLKQQLGDRILGPEMPGVARIRNQFLFRILVRLEPGAPLNTCKQWMHAAMQAVKQTPDGKRVVFQVDVDPY
jgi:primosomal protein N' (replication factor Y)